MLSKEKKSFPLFTWAKEKQNPPPISHKAHITSQKVEIQSSKQIFTTLNPIISSSSKENKQSSQLVQTKKILDSAKKNEAESKKSNETKQVIKRTKFH